jgi:hypothetical protein
LADHPGILSKDVAEDIENEHLKKMV